MSIYLLFSSLCACCLLQILVVGLEFGKLVENLARGVSFCKVGENLARGVNFCKGGEDLARGVKNKCKFPMYSPDRSKAQPLHTTSTQRTTATTPSTPTTKQSTPNFYTNLTSTVTMASIPSNFTEQQTRTAGYSVVQTELKRCKQPAVGNMQDLRLRLIAHIRKVPNTDALAEQPTATMMDGALGAAANGELVPASESVDSTARPATLLGTVPDTVVRVPGQATGAGASHDGSVPLVLRNVTFGGNSGSGFDGDAPSEDEEGQSQLAAGDESSDDGDSDEEDGTEAAATKGADQSTRKKKRKKGAKAAHFSVNDFIRLMHCLMLPQCRTALGALMKNKTREQLEARYEPFTDIAKVFNDFDQFFDHVAADEYGSLDGDVSSPRIDIRNLDPNEHVNETRSAAQLKKKFAEVKKNVTPYFRKWNASGQMTADTAEKSITDFLRPAGSSKKDRHPKEKLIKYVHLLLKGDEDLMTFATKDMGRAGRESGVCPQPPQPPTKRAKGLDRSDLVAAMSVETDSTRKMAAAWQTEAEAKLLDSVTAAIARAATLPAGRLRTMLEAKIEKMLDTPTAEPAEPPGEDTARDASDAAAGGGGGAA